MGGGREGTGRRRIVESKKDRIKGMWLCNRRETAHLLS